LDVPLVYANQRRAIIAIEKGGSWLSSRDLRQKPFSCKIHR
jgi:hypothetical protein